MSLLTQSVAAFDPLLGARLQQQIVTSAIAIASEPSNTPDHANRIALALQVVRNPGGWLAAFQQAVASQGVDNTATDLAIANAVAAVWNAVSG
jgi:hypothetical protein